ncbi:hypothetical protein AB434_2213 [Heyndrickxia coagulans]|uniref:Uncharacterized protein n=1 Tax=Heyndrickxia coagulans TaxID=1398 RepID=A0A133KTX1_HEYCO|nr:hypothetical protein AB434_2213 [Heyndrickxia coagulans]KWZ83038.1 hypothetical protein HMPREF3213_01523 [Heyndrickxia coagulans]
MKGRGRETAGRLFSSFHKDAIPYDFFEKNPLSFMQWGFLSFSIVKEYWFIVYFCA